MNTAEVTYIRAKASYSIFVLASKEEILSSQPVALYSKVLQNAGFFRAHKSFLVNLNHILAIERSGDIILTGDVEIPVAKGNIKAIIQALTDLR